ncbi:MAG: PQQ-binding-like beta-propeller repeat protein [Bacteroidaceae bacterium]|nr:PQQ-binding-like beta-propeller repeat protein [Bacteroidaceae bacterium]MBQ9883059.1 PQQ-binding-like beta-propeller repeat protein [Bacteroidaceae bacterium]
MNKNIFRNVAIVTSVFIVLLSAMLIINYFQVRETTPLQTEVVETLKALNDQNAENVELQEQIRQLDLLARKAYFVQSGHLKAGIYILLGLIGILMVCLRFYFENTKEIPDKEIDPIDDWLIKSKSRKYINWGIVGLAAVALGFAFFSSPYYKTLTEKSAEETAGDFVVEDVANPDDITTDRLPGDALAEANSSEEASAEAEDAETTEQDAEGESAPAEEVPVSKVTQNAFRGNTSNGQSSARGIPTAWNLQDGTNILWKTPVQKGGYNSPVINGRNVFFTGADNAARELYCYDVNTGELKWKLEASGIAGSPSTMPRVNEDTGLAASTVATNGNQVCAIFATGDIICADMEGNKLWAKNLGVPDNHYGFASSLLIYGNIVIVQYDNDTSPKLMALSLANGNTVWSKNRSERATWASPMIAYIDNKPQLIVMGNPNITAYNPANGEQIWQVSCMSGEVGASACASDGIVFGASENAKMVAINASDGQVVWESNEYLPEVSSPAATKDVLFIATSYGVLSTFDTKTGELLAEHDLGVQFYSSPMIVEGKVYLASVEGKIYIFSANKEATLINTIDTGERTFATPAFTDGKMIIRTNESIYCVAAK